MKKRAFFLVSLFIFSWYTHGTIFWQSPIDPLTLPPLTALVTDYSNVLATDTLSWLNSQALTIEQQTTAQIASVLFPHRNGNELFDIGIRLFRESGIWTAETNNWLLLLIATDEKKLRIIVGYWLEWVFPDIRARDLIESTLRPLVDSAQRVSALEAYHQAVQHRLEEVWADSTSWIPTNNYALSIRDLWFFLLWCSSTFRSFRLLNTKKTSLWNQVSPLFPFIGLFFLILVGLPGIVGAFFWYFTWIIWWLIAYPRVWWNTGNFTPRWWGWSPWWSWWFSGWWFGWFGWGSSGWGGAGD